MDSPGNMPTSLGNVWVGEVQSCIVGDGPWQPFPAYPVAPVVVPYVAPQPHTHYHFTPSPTQLSDSDVDRIARRVVELQRQLAADESAPSAAITRPIRKRRR